MANFKSAFAVTMGNEGGYANNPHDAGGETYKGVARNYHSDWPGWKIIDAIKPGCLPDIQKLNIALSQRQDLQTMIQEFYKKFYWDACRLDEVVDQDLAAKIFDMAVNAGTGAAGKLLQQAANYCGATLVVDGSIGSMTVLAVDKIAAWLIRKCFAGMRFDFYKKIVDKNPSQKIFWASWISRI